jgi:cell division septation protein DedD
MLLGYTYGRRQIGAILIDEAVRDLKILDSVSAQSPAPDTVVAAAEKREEIHISSSPRNIRPLTVASGLLLVAVLLSMPLFLGGHKSRLSSDAGPKPVTMSASMLTQSLGEERTTFPAQLVQGREKVISERLNEKEVGERADENQMGERQSQKEVGERADENQMDGRQSQKEKGGGLMETDRGVFYSVHVASFEELSRAKRLEQIIRQNGFDPVFIVPVQFPETGRWLRVLVGKYQDKDAAFRDAQRFLASGMFDYAKPELIEDVNEDERGGPAGVDVMTSQISNSPGAGDE